LLWFSYGRRLRHLLSATIVIIAIIATRLITNIPRKNGE
jgi:hypothetical protein